MNVTCSECQSVFRVDPTKVPANGVRARCAVCGAVIAIEAAAPAAPPAEAAARGTPRTTAAFAWPSATPAGVPVAPVAASAGTPTATPTAAAPPAAPLPPAIPVRPTPAVTATPARPATPAFGGRPSGGAARPINPFLSSDPDQKAKRLARALVSDIVAYHPQLRDQGLREGTLKQLFRDEIKKSYEEYVEQVGKEFAESTAHFQDALNDILAAGRKVF